MTPAGKTKWRWGDKYFRWSSQERGSASQKREWPAAQSCWGFFTPLALLLPSHTSLAKCLHKILAAYWVGVMQRVSPGIARICYYTVFLHRLGLVIQKTAKQQEKCPGNCPETAASPHLGAQSNFVWGPAVRKSTSLQTEFAICCELHAALCYVG